MHAIVMVHKMQRMALSSHSLLVPGGQQTKPESVANNDNSEKGSVVDHPDTSHNSDQEADDTGEEACTEWPPQTCLRPVVRTYLDKIIKFNGC